MMQGPGTMGGPGMMQGPGMMGGPGMMQGPGMMGGPGMMQGPGMMGQQGVNPAERLAAVKTELGITADQEAAWNSYAEALQAHVAQGQTMHQSMWSGQGYDPDAHNAQHRAMWESRQQVANALQNLHSVLTPQQQQQARTLLGQGGCR
jgi:hypothetical protein